MLSTMDWWDISTDNKTYFKLIRRQVKKGYGASQSDTIVTFVGSTSGGNFPPLGKKCLEFCGEITPEHHNQTLMFTINQEQIRLITIKYNGANKFEVLEGTDLPVLVTEHGLIYITRDITYYTYPNDIPENAERITLVHPVLLLAALERGKC